jgi:hypothetical protein
MVVKALVLAVELCKGMIHQEEEDQDITIMGVCLLQVVSFHNLNHLTQEKQKERGSMLVLTLI